MARSDVHFEFPWQHDFPPFFTLQPNRDTRQVQLDAWISLINSWCWQHRKQTLHAPQCLQEAPFTNSKIGRSLSESAFQAVAERLIDKGLAEWDQLSSGGSKSGAAKGSPTSGTLIVYCRSLADWAKQVYTWAESKGLVGSVCTLFELTASDAAKNNSFYRLDQNILTRALRVLESQGRAAIVEVDDAVGVKFL